MWDPLASAAAMLPTKPALVEAEGPISSFSELWNAAVAVAAFLQRDVGLQKGEVVAVAAEGTREFVAAMYGTSLAGGVVAPINAAVRDRDLAMQLENCEPVAAFARGDLASSMAGAALLGDADHVRRVYRMEDLWSVANENGYRPEPVSIDPESDLALLPYSSGTSGLPKSVMLNHANLVAAWRQRVQVSGLSERSVVLSTRVFHAAFRLTVAAGATCVTQKSTDPERTLHLMALERATQVWLRPWYLRELVRGQEARRHQFPDLEFLQSSEDFLPPSLAGRARHLFKCPVLQAYNMTETAGSSNHTMMGRTSSRSVGPPVPDTEERIVDPESGREVRPGRPGELQIRGPQVMMGYWGDEELTAQALLPDGWLRTGDIARTDPRGDVVIVGRQKDMFKVRGIPVAPAQVEAVLLEHPGVKEAAVVGGSFATEGELATAFVVAREGEHPNKQEITTFIQARLAPHKWLRDIQFVAELPRNSRGKIVRELLAPS